METNNNQESESRSKIDWDFERESHLDARLERIENRLEKVEKRGMFLKSFSDEKIYLFLFGAYIVFGFVLPFVADLAKRQGAPSITK